MSLTLQFLGTGTSVGIPQIGCQCPTCTSTDVRATVALDRRPDGSGGTTLLRGRITSAGEYRLKTSFSAGGVISARVVRADQNGSETAVTSTQNVSGTYSAGTVVRMRLEVVGASPTTLRAKVWTAATEPTAWLVTGTDVTAALQAPGHVGLASLVSTSTTNVPVTYRWDDLVVRAG